MWRGMILTLLGEVVLYGIGRLTVPLWVDENIHIWLPAAFALLLIGMCWEQWPRWMQFRRVLFWADIETAAREFRDEMDKNKLARAGGFFDGLAQEASGNNGNVLYFMGYLKDGVNKGHMEVRGTPEYGKKERSVPTPVNDFVDQHPRSSDSLVGADERRYFNIQVKRSGIRNYVSWLATKND